MKRVSLQRYLLERCQKGDAKAQYEVYHLYVDAMYSTCKRMLGNDEEAKDVLQEAFVQVFLKIKDLKDLSSFPAWIKRIVVNKCLGALRGRKNFVDIDNVPSHESTGDPFEQQSGIGWSPQGYKTQEVMKAIDQISEGCRTVLNLYLFEGYDHQEIAQILGCSVSTSKAQYSRARSKVRKIIGQTLEP